MFTIAPHLVQAIMLAAAHKMHSSPPPGLSQPGSGRAVLVLLLALVLVIAAAWTLSTVAQATGALMGVIGHLVRAAVAVGAALVAVILTAAAVIVLLIHH